MLTPAQLDSLALRCKQRKLIGFVITWREIEQLIIAARVANCREVETLDDLGMRCKKRWLIRHEEVEFLITHARLVLPVADPNTKPTVAAHLSDAASHRPVDFSPYPDTHPWSSRP